MSLEPEKRIMRHTHNFYARMRVTVVESEPPPNGFRSCGSIKQLNNIWLPFTLPPSLGLGTEAASEWNFRFIIIFPFMLPSRDIYSFYVLKHSISFHKIASTASDGRLGMCDGMRKEKEREKMKSAGVVTEESGDKLRKSWYWSEEKLNHNSANTREEEEGVQLDNVKNFHYLFIAFNSQFENNWGNYLHSKTESNPCPNWRVNNSSVQRSLKIPSYSDSFPSSLQLKIHSNGF